MTPEEKNCDEKDVQFNLDTVEQTFTKYKINQIVDGVVVEKREDGVIFNIGGKLDAFIPKSDFKDYSLVKAGERFKGAISALKNENGMIEVSKAKADNFLIDNLEANELKIGKTFTFVVTGFNQDGATSSLGEYKIFVKKDEVSTKPFKTLKQFLNKRIEAIVTDFDKENKFITASATMLENRVKQNIELAFWNSVFVNKLVSGTVVKELPFGVLVNVNGVMCFCHISQISHKRISKATDVLHIGNEYTFKVLEVDRENKKVSLTYKQLQPSEKQQKLSALKVGSEVKGKVTSLLEFGAIVEIDENLTGLLHVSDASAVYGTFIKDIVSRGEVLDVIIKSVDAEKGKLSLALKEKR